MIIPTGSDGEEQDNNKRGQQILEVVDDQGLWGDRDSGNKTNTFLQLNLAQPLRLLLPAVISPFSCV